MDIDVRRVFFFAFERVCKCYEYIRVVCTCTCNMTKCFLTSISMATSDEDETSSSRAASLSFVGDANITRRFLADCILTRFSIPGVPQTGVSTGSSSFWCRKCSFERLFKATNSAYSIEAGIIYSRSTTLIGLRCKSAVAHTKQESVLGTGVLMFSLGVRFSFNGGARLITGVLTTFGVLSFGVLGVALSPHASFGVIGATGRIANSLFNSLANLLSSKISADLRSSSSTFCLRSMTISPSCQ